MGKQEHKRKGDRLIVFIEMRDVNYPGSTYRLAFTPEPDRLAGGYFQAQEYQTFDERFVKKR